jgi:hypothetical protein
MAETPRFAHLGVLLFLGGGFLVLVCLVIALMAAASRAFRIAKLAAAGAALSVCSYAALLLAVAVATPNKTLPSGGRKYFCEADCHIAYSTESVQFAATLGPQASPVAAHGQFAVVRLKTWFDEHSIAPWRGDSPLTPDPRMVQVVDGAGNRYLPLPASAVPSLVSLPRKASTPLDEPLRPGDSYTTTLVFDVPAGIRNAKLLIADREPMSQLPVDHENSPLHGKIYLALSSALPISARTQP